MHTLNSLDPQLESAWFQHLILKCDLLVSKFPFKFNLYRYNTVMALQEFCSELEEEVLAEIGGSKWVPRGTKTD